MLPGARIAFALRADRNGALERNGRETGLRHVGIRVGRTVASTGRRLLGYETSDAAMTRRTG